MTRLLITMLALFTGLLARAQQPVPILEYVMDLKVTIAQSIEVGSTPQGKRIVIPITGGTFEGPLLTGVVLAGGADYQLYHKDAGRTDLEAIYNICTNDGVNIHVRNVGMVTNNGDKTYFYCTPKFEAPLNSRYSWLNNAIFVCRPVGGGEGLVVLRVWKVTDAPNN